MCDKHVVRLITALLCIAAELRSFFCSSAPDFIQDADVALPWSSFISPLASGVCLKCLFQVPEQVPDIPVGVKVTRRRLAVGLS